MRSANKRLMSSTTSFFLDKGQAAMTVVRKVGKQLKLNLSNAPEPKKQAAPTRPSQKLELLDGVVTLLSISLPTNLIWDPSWLLLGSGGRVSFVKDKFMADALCNASLLEAQLRAA